MSGEIASESSISIGQRMPDGTIYAGNSPETGEAMYTTPEDARMNKSWWMRGSDPLTFTFNQARKYAAKLVAHGHDDWRVPTRAELRVLFENKAAIGGFNNIPLNRRHLNNYRSSDERKGWAGWILNFREDNSRPLYDYKNNGYALRCVRGFG